jgi:hypothetical protein
MHILVCLFSGGIYSPGDCTSRQQLAVIIPFRNRESQLKILLRHLHPFLQRQKRSYRIFVVEQVHIINLLFHLTNTSCFS